MNAHASRVEAGPSPIDARTGGRTARALSERVERRESSDTRIHENRAPSRHRTAHFERKSGPKLDAFMEDHKKHFRVSFGEAAAIVAMIAAFLLAAWLFWELIGPNAF